MSSFCLWRNPSSKRYERYATTVEGRPQTTRGGFAAHFVCKALYHSIVSRRVSAQLLVRPDARPHSEKWKWAQILISTSFALFYSVSRADDNMSGQEVDVISILQPQPHLHHLIPNPSPGSEPPCFAGAEYSAFHLAYLHD